MSKHAQKFLALVNELRSEIKECSVLDVKARLENKEIFELIDVREDHEWERGHLPTAQHLGKGIIERDIEALYPDSSKELILYCGGGYRSVLAAHTLQKMGYTNVVSMDGGFRGWIEAGGEVEK